MINFIFYVIGYTYSSMSNKNILANKKRKKIKFDVTTGSISGYLLSSLETGEIESSSDTMNSAETDSVHLSSSSTDNVRKRLSNEFDDSFDLFTSKKISDIKNVELLNTKIQNTLKNSKINDMKSDVSCGRSRNNFGKSKVKLLRKSNYFNNCDDYSFDFPCPFCFKFEKNISAHIKNKCSRHVYSNEIILSQLIKLHSDYWNQRRVLGIPDNNTLNEDDFFKKDDNCNSHRTRDISESLNCDPSFLKWSKAKRNKYVLLRQSRSERENKITEKLAIVLMGNETKQVHEEEQSYKPFLNTVNKTLHSQQLADLLSKELTFWKKSNLNADRCGEMFYVKALAPFIAPVRQNKNCSDDAEGNVEVFSPAIDSPIKETSIINEVKSSTLNKSLLKINGQCVATVNSEVFSCSTEDDVSAYVSNSSDHLANDWEKLFNCPDLSDMLVLLKCGSLFAHSIVFWVRSIKIFRSISSGSSEHQGKLLDWKDVPFKAGRAFIRFIYTGKTRHLEEMENRDLEYVMKLCEKYDQYNLKIFISNVIEQKSSEIETPEGISTTNDDCLSVIESRRLTSPDIFQDNLGVEVCNTHSLTQTEFVESSSTSSSKRKLKPEPSSKKLSDFDSVKKLKMDPAHDEICPVSASTDRYELKEDTSSINSADVISIKSGETVNVKGDGCGSSTNRPLSQCSTLPPLCESPETSDTPFSPDEPLTHFDLNTNMSHFQNNELSVVNGLPVEKGNVDVCYDSPRDNCFYDNDVFDFNNCTDLPDTDEESNRKDSHRSDKTTIVPKQHTSPRKNSLDRYFDDSLALHLFDRTLNDDCPNEELVKKCLQGSPMCQSTPTRSVDNKDNLKTPTAQILVSDQVTPLLNYSTLISPQLKGELKKYGLKPDMDRNKAKTLLKYIYDLVHPVITQSENNGSISNNRPSASPESGQESSENHPIALECHEMSSADIYHNDDSKNIMDCDFELTQESSNSQEKSSYLNKNELLESVSAFIKKDPVLFDSTLNYVPVWLSKFHSALKEIGIRCTKNDLMDVLDELCVTFRTERKAKGKM